MAEGHSIFIFRTSLLVKYRTTDYEESFTQKWAISIRRNRTSGQRSNWTRMMRRLVAGSFVHFFDPRRPTVSWKVSTRALVVSHYSSYFSIALSKQAFRHWRQNWWEIEIFFSFEGAFAVNDNTLLLTLLIDEFVTKKKFDEAIRCYSEMIVSNFWKTNELFENTLYVCEGDRHSNSIISRKINTSLITVTPVKFFPWSTYTLSWINDIVCIRHFDTTILLDGCRIEIRQSPRFSSRERICTYKPLSMSMRRSTISGPRYEWTRRIRNISLS